MRRRLPIINSGARVPMRRETWNTRWTALVSLDNLTISRPVVSGRCCRKKPLDFPEQSFPQTQPPHLDKISKSDMNCNSERPTMIAESEEPHSCPLPYTLIDDALDEGGWRGRSPGQWRAETVKLRRSSNKVSEE
jgi:hypothetical protein